VTTSSKHVPAQVDETIVSAALEQLHRQFTAAGLLS
jgi:hypothetical protein